MSVSGESSSDAGPTGIFEDPTLCSSCTTPLGEIFILCNECRKPSVRLCLFCFSCAVELKTIAQKHTRSHKKSHSYRVVNAAESPLFAPSGTSSAQFCHEIPWGRGEEETLLDGVERFHLGNWEELVKTIGEGKRTAAEARLHYDRYFIQGRIGRATTKFFQRPICHDHTGPSQQQSVANDCDHLPTPTFPSGANNSSKKSPKKELKADQLPITSNGAAVSDQLCCLCHNGADPSGPLVPGGQNSPPVRQSTLRQNPDDLKLMAYMPNRDDFEKEFHNDAEDVVAGLNGIHGLPEEKEEADMDRSLKLARMDMYCRLLRERRRRKAVVRDYDLVPKFLKEQKPSMAKSTMLVTASPLIKAALKEERELADNMKNFSQFLPSDEFGLLVTGLVKEGVLKDKVQQLQKLKRQGVEKLDDKMKTFDIKSLPLVFEAHSATLKLPQKRRRRKVLGNTTQNRTMSRFIRWRKLIARQSEVEAS